MMMVIMMLLLMSLRLLPALWMVRSLVVVLLFVGREWENENYVVK